MLRKCIFVLSLLAVHDVMYDYHLPLFFLFYLFESVDAWFWFVWFREDIYNIYLFLSSSNPITLGCHCWHWTRKEKKGIYGWHDNVFHFNFPAYLLNLHLPGFPKRQSCSQNSFPQTRHVHKRNQSVWKSHRQEQYIIYK